MASLNINSDVTDPFYRYKMPRILAKVEGKGNGIKTVIVNMPDVSRALGRPATYPTKFFGCELGAQTQFDLKNERFIVNGSHDSSKLQSLLDVFIKKFVLCQECSNPETTLVIKKNNTIVERCLACGAQGNIDMKHKLTTFIIKNPPDQDTTVTPSKKDKKAKRDKGKKDEKDGANRSPENGVQDTTTSSQKQMMDHRAKGGDVEAPPEASTDEDDVDWGDEEFTADAIKQRMEGLSDAAKGLTMTDDLEKSEKQRLDMFYNFIKEKRDFGGLTGAEVSIVAEADRLEIKDVCPLILVELLLTEKIITQIKDHRVLFLRFCHDNHKGQKYLLGGLEQLIGNVHKDVLMSKIPQILNALYDADILEEEVILDWDKKVSKKYVSKDIAKEIHEKATPFIKWLKEAEEEEDEDEEEDDVKIVYSTTEKIGTHNVDVKKPHSDTDDDNGLGDEEDDFDIDAL